MSAPALGSGPLSTRPSYRGLTAYNVESVPLRFDLSDNTSQLGAPPAAARALVEFAADAAVLGARYPSLYSPVLRELIAAYAGVAPDEIVVGCGSDDILDSTMRALSEPGTRLAFMDPTFVMARTFAIANSLVPVAVPLTAEWDIDADGLIESRAQLTYLCTPNNPTGTTASRAAIERVLDEASGIVVVDEAYGEFASEAYVAEAPSRGRVLVTRTFSKAFGLAGLRVGYGVGSRTLIGEIEKARGPYKVTSPSERAAEAALREDVPWMRAGVASVVESRRQFMEALRALGLTPLPSDANFLLVPVKDARAIAQALRAHGIGIRAFPGLTRVGDAIRISIAPWPIMSRVVSAMREVLSCA